MKAAVITSFDRPPGYADFREPEPSCGELLVRVRASALSNLTRIQASGRHYSSAAMLPLVPGSDGVGTLPDGRRVYFLGPPAPFGAMAEWSLAAPSRTIPIPDGVDDLTAAALGNPGIASWGALIGRGRLQPGECILINGATGVSGQQAIQVAKYLGARKVIATGRNEQTLSRLASIGADQTIALEQPDDALKQAFRAALAEVDVVADYLWGRSAECLLAAARGHGAPDGERRIRYLQVGSASGGAVSLDAQWLRSSGLELLGSGLGSLSAEAIVRALKQMFAAAASTALRIDIDAIPLSDVEAMWNRTQSGRRVVFLSPS